MDYAIKISTDLFDIDYRGIQNTLNNTQNISDIDSQCPEVLINQQRSLDYITDDDIRPIKNVNNTLVLDQIEYNIILSKDSKDEPIADNNLLQSDQTSSHNINQGFKGKTRGHHKQGSDCTLIDGLQQELELATTNNDLPNSVIKEPDKCVGAKEASSTTTIHDKLKPDSNPLTHFVSFIRTNSLRFKRNLNKEVKDDTKKKEELPQLINHEAQNQSQKVEIEVETTIELPEKDIAQSRSYSDFEEICRSAHGLLRRSEPGPITFNSGDYHTKFNMSRKSGLSHTFPSRSRSKFETADSGFESCTSSVFSQSVRRKKCVVPLTLYHEVSKSAGNDEFQFREINSPNSLLTCEAMLPALTDVSDDEYEDKPELFFGKFPCKPKIPLKTARDVYHAQTQYLEFSDSDSDEPFINTKRAESQSCLPSTSRSSSSGSCMSRGDIKRILTEWSLPNEPASDESTELVISPCPGDCESLEKIFSEGVESVEMVCESGSENKILTGRIVLWTPEYKQKIKKVFICRQRVGSTTPDNSLKIMKENGNWSISKPSNMMEGSHKTAIFLTVETDTERSESISTTATSPIYEDGYNEENFDTDEELYFNMREQMRNLDQDIDNTPNQDDLPCSVIDYMNRDLA